MDCCDSFIQVIDCSSILGQYEEVTEQSYAKVSEELGKAMSGIGFAYLINHGVDLDKLTGVNKAAEKFFTLPTAVKRKYCKLDPIANFHGYAPPGDELHDAVKNSTECREAFDIFGFDAQDSTKYPQEVPGFKEAFDDARQDFNNLGKKLLKCFGKYLKLDDDTFFVERHKNLDDPNVPTHTQLRALYYYTLSNKSELPEDAIRLGEHSDWGSITLLFQDMVGGLEIKTRTGKWIQATPIKDSIILNNGDLMELWTKGVMHAALHRVKITKSSDIKPRQSFIHFINPDGAEEVRPILSIPPDSTEFLNRFRPVIAMKYTEAKYKALLNY